MTTSKKSFFCDDKEQEALTTEEGLKILIDVNKVENVKQKIQTAMKLLRECYSELEEAEK